MQSEAVVLVVAGDSSLAPRLAFRLASPPKVVDADALAESLARVDCVVSLARPGDDWRDALETARST